MNPNVDVPMPKTIQLKKLAINLPEFEELRKFGQKAADIPEPADAIELNNQNDGLDDTEVANWLLNEWNRSKSNSKKPRKRQEQYKVCDFVDTTKAVEGSESSEAEEDIFKKAKSKAARAELESAEPGQNEENQTRRGRRGRPK